MHYEQYFYILNPQGLTKIPRMISELAYYQAQSLWTRISIISSVHYKTRCYLAQSNVLFHFSVNEWFQNPVTLRLSWKGPWSNMLANTRSRKARSRRTEIRSEPNLRLSLTVYTKRNEPVSKFRFIGLHMPAILSRDVFSQSS